MTLSAEVDGARNTDIYNHWDVVILVSLCLVAAAAFLIYLNHNPLYYDEAIYGQVAKETVEGNHWLTLYWNNQPWFHKPPLYFWTTAILFKVFGASEFWARAPSAFDGVVCVGLSYLIARHLYGRTSAILSALILITSPLFVVSARSGMTDVFMTAFMLLAVYAYLLSARNSRRWILVGVACGLAVLTKGAAGLLTAAIIGIAQLLDHRWQEVRGKHFWIAVAAFVLLAVPWHLILIGLHGNDFVKVYFFRHIIERSTSDLHLYQYGYSFYLTALWQFFWPWVLLMPLIFAGVLGRRGSIVLLIQALLPLVLFSLARTKFSWYIVPILPALAILVAFGTARFIERSGLIFKRLAWILIGLFALTGALAVYSYTKPNKRIEAVVALMPIAAKDGGAISTSPESLEMTVLYYTNRKLCSDPVVSPLAVRPETKCEQREIRNFVFEKDRRELIESRFGPLRVVAESGDMVYGEVIT